MELLAAWLRNAPQRSTVPRWPRAMLPLAVPKGRQPPGFQVVFEDSPDGKPVIQRCSTLRLGTARPGCHCHAPSPRHAPHHATPLLTTPRPSSRHAPPHHATSLRHRHHARHPGSPHPYHPWHRCSISSTPSDHRSFLNMCSQLRGHDVHPDTGAGIIQSMCCSPVDSLG